MNKLLKKKILFIWTNKQEKAFRILKQKLIEALILQYSDFEKPFILFTDISKIGLRAVLSQLDNEEKEKIIIYASRSLNSAEQNYLIIELECLAVIWAVRYFYKYLLTKSFKIVTDYSVLKTLQIAKILIGKRAWWIMELQYDFKIIHRVGKENANADALSRIKEKLKCKKKVSFQLNQKYNEIEVYWSESYKYNLNLEIKF